MRYYNINAQGKFRVPRLAAHPPDVIGRIYLLTTDHGIYFSNGTNHYNLVAADGGTYNINVSGSAGTAKYS